VYNITGLVLGNGRMDFVEEKTMKHAMRCGAWMVAVMFWAMGLVALAQEAPPAKPAPPKGPSPEQRAKLNELNQRINRMVVEAAEKIPELKAMHEAQLAKMRAVSEKRAAIVAANPELKALQDEVDAANKKERELAKEMVAKNPELAEMEKQLKELREKFEAKRREVVGASPEITELRKGVMERQGKMFAALRNDPDVKKMNAEADAAWNELVKNASETSPEIGKAVEERNALMKAAAPARAPAPGEKPKEGKPAK